MQTRSLPAKRPQPTHAGQTERRHGPRYGEREKSRTGNGDAKTNRNRANKIANGIGLEPPRWATTAANHKPQNARTDTYRETTVTECLNAVRSRCNAPRPDWPWQAQY
eukprot:5253031-Alexandrium_andersonii.AAC.1